MNSVGAEHGAPGDRDGRVLRTAVPHAILLPVRAAPEPRAFGMKRSLFGKSTSVYCRQIAPAVPHAVSCRKIVAASK